MAEFDIDSAIAEMGGPGVPSPSLSEVFAAIDQMQSPEPMPVPHRPSPLLTAASTFMGSLGSSFTGNPALLRQVQDMLQSGTEAADTTEKENIKRKDVFNKEKSEKRLLAQMKLSEMEYEKALKEGDAKRALGELRFQAKLEKDQTEKKNAFDAAEKAKDRANALAVASIYAAGRDSGTAADVKRQNALTNLQSSLERITTNPAYRQSKTFMDQEGGAKLGPLTFGGKKVKKTEAELTEEGAKQYANVAIGQGIATGDEQIMTVGFQSAASMAMSAQTPAVRRIISERILQTAAAQPPGSNIRKIAMQAVVPLLPLPGQTDAEAMAMLKSMGLDEFVEMEP